MKDSSFKVFVLVAAVIISLVAAGLVRGSPVQEAQAPSGPEQLEITIYAHEDTFIADNYGDDNFGDWGSLYAGNSGSASRDILLDFDLSVLPPDAVIVSATLELIFYVNRDLPSQEPYTITAFVNTEDWQEMAVTWNNAPNYIYNFDPSSPVPSFEESMHWDVTNTVDDWVNGVLTNYGFRLYGDRFTQRTVEFYSREHGLNQPPRLIIAYTSGAVTPTPTSTATDTPPATATPTPPGYGSCPGTVYVYADEDTYVNAQYPETEYGHLDYLWLKREFEHPQDTQRNMFLHFPIEALLPPGTNIYKATLMLRVIATEGDASPYWRTALVSSPEDPFDEDTTNWNNQPAMAFFEGSFDVSAPSGWHTADLTGLVRDWYTGAEPNNGIGILASVPMSDTYAVQYWSRNYSDAAYRPRLEIECGDAPPTPTPTPTRTPTRTPTATPTITPTPVPETGNVVAYHMGVSQGVQDFQHSIPLMEGKRTYIRIAYDLHNPVPNYIYNTTAKVNIYRGGVWQASLAPINNWNGYLELVDIPWYSVPHNTFIFELPTEYTTGEIRLQGIVDPDWDLPESSHADNYINRTVSFEPAVEKDMYLYLVKHIAADGTVNQVSYSDVQPSWEVAMATLPFVDVNTTLRTLDWDEATMGEMTCVGVNNLLIFDWLAEVGGQATPTYYYALMPGWGDGTSCAAGIPAMQASSWAGSSRTTMAHELGHCLGRHHTQNPRYDDGGNAYNIGCGAKTGCWYSPTFNWVIGCPNGFENYPYDDGSMSPYAFGSEAVYGFYHNAWIESGANDYWTSEFFVADYSWKDLMTYCKPERWTSDFTWENIYDDWFSLDAQGGFALEQTDQVTPTDTLVAVGTIVSSTGEIEMKRLYVLPDVTWAPEPVPGDFAIVLYDGSHTELLRHEFSPGLVDVEDFGNVLSMGEMVPYVEGTVQVDIVGPTGVLTSVVSGAAPPTVTVIYPSAVDNVSSEDLLVTWTGSDPDGDPLSYNVQFSDDNGATWRLVASDVFSTGVWIDSANLPGTNWGRFRVLASDGIHTASDISDRAFIVPNHRPSVKILTPMDGDIYIVSQTVGLEAQVYDVEDGTLDPGHLRWYSTLDGILGNGAQVSLASLTPGEHTIVFVAVDSDGATDSDAVQITVYAGPDELPPMPDMLRADPSIVVLDALVGAGSRPIYVYNHTNPDAIPWTAQASEPWVYLSDYSGTTAEMVTVWASTYDLPDGHYTATVTFTNVDNPAETATVNLSVTARRFPIYLPLILRAHQ
jgi:hypothetical protein